jgi:hypothetical protein
MQGMAGMGWLANPNNDNPPWQCFSSVRIPLGTKKPVNSSPVPPSRNLMKKKPLKHRQGRAVGSQ